MGRSSDNSEDILSRLDVAAEYRSMGVEFTGRTPNADGWLECWAMGRPHGDKPNAGCNLQTGRYKDFGHGGDNLSLWDFAARYGGHATWQAARDHFAAQVGVKVNGQHSPKARKPDEHLEFDDWNDTIVALWLRHKKGITTEALQAAGARLARYRHQYTVVALPVFSWPLLPDADAPKPVGWVMWNTTGGELPVKWGDDGKPTAYAKMKTAGGSASGLMGLSGLQAIAAGTVERVLKVEGPSDMLAVWAIIPSDQRHRFVVVTNSSGAGEQPQPHIVQAFSGRPRVDVLHDADVPGEVGAVRWAEAIAGVAPDVRRATLPFPVEEKKGKDLRDWVNERAATRDRTFADLLALLDAGEPARADSRPDIEITPDEHLCNDKAVDALSRDTLIFKRGTILTHVVPTDDADPETDLIVRPKGTPQIQQLPRPMLRERLTANARFIRVRGDSTVRIHPPEFLVAAVDSRGRWPGIRQLEGIVNCPVIRSDGSIIDTPGWDQRTGLLYDPTGEFPDIPEHPTRDDAKAAAAVLADLVCDFPFEAPEHQSAWLAFLLTPLARYAFSGPAPLFLVDANVRGSGKSLLNDLVSIVVSGRDMPRMSNAREDEECRKRITSIAIAGDQMILLDNLDGNLGCASLDAALTATSWKDRLLGASKTIEVPLVLTWSASGNNVSIKADTSRRTCWIRLMSRLENPEERSGFKYPMVKQHALRNRGRYVVAGLTILRAFCVAGRPAQGLKSWGSFEGWSALVREAIVWAGLPDPGITRQELAKQSDSEVGLLRDLIEAWRRFDPAGTGATVREILDACKQDHYEYFADAIKAICDSREEKLPTAKSLAGKLKKYKERVIDGFYVDSLETGHARKKVWFPREASVMVNVVNNGEYVPSNARKCDLLLSSKEEKDKWGKQIHQQSPYSPTNNSPPDNWSSDSSDFEEGIV